MEAEGVDGDVDAGLGSIDVQDKIGFVRVQFFLVPAESPVEMVG